MERQTVVKTLKVLGKSQGSTMLGNFSKSKFNSWKILIGTILSARARDEVTEPLSKELFKKYPTAKKLANAKQKDVEKLIKRIGFYRNKSKNIINASKMVVEKFKGKVPDNFSDLMELPGVGRKVAGCVIVYAHNKEAIPVDTHVHRISNRLGWVKTKTPNKTEIELEKLVPKKYWMIVNDFLVYHGKTICKPQIPLCSRCAINKYCEKIGVINYK